MKRRTPGTLHAGSLPASRALQGAAVCEEHPVKQLLRQRLAAGHAEGALRLGGVRGQVARARGLPAVQPRRILRVVAAQQPSDAQHGLQCRTTCASHVSAQDVRPCSSLSPSGKGVCVAAVLLCMTRSLRHPCKALSSSCHRVVPGLHAQLIIAYLHHMHLCSSARRISAAPARLARFARFSRSTVASTSRLASARAACSIIWYCCEPGDRAACLLTADSLG